MPTSLFSMSSTFKDRVLLPIELMQLPVISNTATTGHNLQGTGVDNLFVSEWVNDASWIYVILSRVKQRKGLFLRKELKPDPFLFQMPNFLQQKINYFRLNCMREELEESDYQEINDGVPIPKRARAF